MADELLLGRYRLTETAGHGGFATVEVAWDTRLQRRVAVKRIALRDEAGATATAGLMEARTAAMLSDEHIVKVIDFEATAEEALIIMEHIDGPDLAQLMRSSERLLDLASIAAITRDVGGALSHAHANQVLHLDIKPANILFDPNGHAKVSDFGMAMLSARQGYGEPQGGTVGYMPPEQIEGGRVDERTDLWAFAVLLYQLLVGNNPYLVADAEESLHRIATLSLPLPSQVRDDLAPEADMPLISALSADMRWRQDSIGEFVGELMPCLGSARSGHAALRRQAGVTEAGDGDGPPTRQTATSGSRQPKPHGSDRPADRSADRSADAGLPASDGEASRQDGQADPQEDATLPLPWRRLERRRQNMLSRLLAAFAAAAMSFVGLSGFGLLGLGGGGVATGRPWRPVGGSAGGLGEAASNLSASDYQVQVILVVGVLAIIALVAMAAPTLGSAMAMLAFCAGIFARGLVMIGVLALLVSLAWWLMIGRRGWPESTLVPLSVPLAWALAPASIPLLAAMYMKPSRALGSTLACWLVLLGLGGLSMPGSAIVSTGSLFSAGAVLGNHSSQFPAGFWQLATSRLSWVSLAACLASTGCMLLFCRPRRTGLAQARRAIEGGQGWRDGDQEAAGALDALYPSRLRLMLGAVLATFIQFMGIVVVPLLSGDGSVGGSLETQAVRIGLSLALVTALVVTGVVPGRGIIDRLLETDGEERL